MLNSTFIVIFNSYSNTMKNIIVLFLFLQMKILVKEKSLRNLSEVTQPKPRFKSREISPLINYRSLDYGGCREMRKGKNLSDMVLKT